MAVAPQDQTKTAGSSGGKDFEKSSPTAASSSVSMSGRLYGNAEKVIYAICPIYQTLAGRQRGKSQGSKPGEARENHHQKRRSTAMLSPPSASAPVL